MSTTLPDTLTPADPAAGTAQPVLALDLVPDPAVLPSLAELAEASEEAGLGALTLSDGPLHPTHAASYLAPLTSRIALLARTDAVHVEPFHLATQLMSLDHISHGRAGWLLRAETDPQAAAAVGRETLPAAARAREAGDVLTASRLVWDSWAEDAVVRDADRGLYLDASRLQYADFQGETFSVRGPAITPRSPQGLLPVLVADADRADVGDRVATELADGRALDVPLAPGVGAEDLAAQITRALNTAATAPATEGAFAAVRLVRLVGTPADADPAALRALLTELVERLAVGATVAPPPAAWARLRDQLGLPVPAFHADPARRADRARTHDSASTPDSTRTPVKETA